VARIARLESAKIQLQRRFIHFGDDYTGTNSGDAERLKKQISLPSEFKIHEFKINNTTLLITKVTITFSILITTKIPNNVVLLNNGYVMKIEAMYALNQ